MSKYAVLLFCLFYLLTVSHGQYDQGQYYRIKVRDQSGGYVLNKLNDGKEAPVRVAAMATSLLSQDVLMTLNSYTRLLGTNLVVYQGFISRYRAATGAVRSLLNVTTVYLGMPSPNVGRVINSKLSFFAINARTRKLTVRRLNSKTVYGVRWKSTFSAKGVNLPYLDTEWQTNQVVQWGAIFTAKRTRKMTAAQVFVRLPIPGGFCPMFPERACGPKEQRTYKRTADLCFIAGCISSNAKCKSSAPVCKKGYRLACWPGSNGCTEYKCDPIFAPTASMTC